MAGQREALENLLLSIRAATEAALALVRGGVDQVGPENDEDGSECRHPNDKRVEVLAMGRRPGWLCQACGYIYDPNEEVT